MLTPIQLDIRDILSQVCAKYWIFQNCMYKLHMASSEAMTSSTRSFAYSYRLVKKCFVKIWETSKCHNFLIFQPIFIRFSLFCSQYFTLSSEIKLNLFRSSPLINCRIQLLSKDVRNHFRRGGGGGAQHFCPNTLSCPESRLCLVTHGRGSEGRGTFTSLPWVSIIMHGGGRCGREYWVGEK